MNARIMLDPLLFVLDVDSFAARTAKRLRPRSGSFGTEIAEPSFAVML
jgi:hypothetical protein